MAEVLKIAVPRYPHGGCDNPTGNLKIMGDMIVWNYLDGGVPLSWYNKRGFEETDILDSDDLLFIRKPPTTSLKVVASVASNKIGNTGLAKKDFEFTYRYVYDSGERSVIGQPFTLFKARVGVETITISGFGDFPEYATSIEIYVRNGNSGVWSRIRTQDDTSSFEWRGEINESLSDDEAITYIHQVPLETKSIEIAKSYVFMGNNVMDYDKTNYGITLSVGSSTGFDLDDGQYLYTYLNRGPRFLNTLERFSTNDNLSDRDSYDWIMPFANNSSYVLGIAFFDSRYRTRGVERTAGFTCSNIEYDSDNVFFSPYLELNTTKANDFPEWAEYYMVCSTKNLTMDSFYEGYPSDYFFSLEINGNTYYQQDVNQKDMSSVKYLVLDISGMMKEGHIYSYQDGDMMILNIIYRGTLTAFEFRVAYQDGKHVFCHFEGYEKMYGSSPLKDLLFADFIIYSPAQETSENIFYPFGQLRPVSEISAGPSTYRFENKAPGVDGVTGVITLDRVIGDCVFKEINLYPYTRGTLRSVTIPDEYKKTIIQNPFYSDLDYTIGAGLPNWVPFTVVEESMDGGAVTAFEDGYTLGATITEAKVVFSCIVRLDVPSPTTDTFKYYHSLYVNGSKYGSSDIDIVDVETTEDDEEVYTTIHYERDVPSGFSVDDLIQIRLQISNENADIPGGVLYITNTSLVISDTSKTVQRSEIDFDVPYEDDPFVVLLREMGDTVGYSWNRSQGIPLLESTGDPNRRYFNQIRHGGKYLQNLKINNISNFTALRLGESPTESGPIEALVVANKENGQGNVMLSITKNETNSIYIEEQILRESGSTEIVAISNTVIGTINRLRGSYGTSDPRSIYQVNGNVYWWDDLEKKVIRYGRNGLEVLDSKMSSYFRKRDGDAVVFYDPFYKMVLFWFEGDSEETRAVGYYEPRGRWTTFVSYNPSVSAHLDDYMFSCVVEGNELVLSKSLRTDNYNNFYGDNTSRETKITFSMSSPIPLMLTNITIRHNSDVIDWGTANGVDDGLLKILISNENGQETTVYNEMLMMEKNMLYAHILRDENSVGGIIEGESMEGYSHDVTLQIPNAAFSVHQYKQFAVLVLSLGYHLSSGHKI